MGNTWFQELIIQAGGAINGASAPGGANTDVQFNDAGSLAGNAALVFDKTTGSFINIVNPAGAGESLIGSGTGPTDSFIGYATATAPGSGGIPTVFIECNEAGGNAVFGADDAVSIFSTNAGMFISTADDLELTVTGVGKAVKLEDNSGNVVISAGQAGALGFFNTAGTTKPTVTGSRAGNAALASLLTALAAFGLITNSTTA